MVLGGGWVLDRGILRRGGVEAGRRGGQGRGEVGLRQSECSQESPGEEYIIQP